MSEGDDNISMKELDDGEPAAEESPADAEETPADEGEEAEQENEGGGSGAEEDAPNVRENPTLTPVEGNEQEEQQAEEQAEEGRMTPAQPRLITVTPTPGNTSPDIKSDCDSGVKIDNEEDDEDDDIPQKPNRSPSLASSEGSLRSMSPEPAQAPKKGGSSQPPRFTNEVQPEGYRRPAGPGFNRAVGTLQCKAMIVIMGASLIAMVFIVGYIILQSDDEITTKTVSLDGNFTIGNRAYINAYEDPNSTLYGDLSQEFINTMNDTFYLSTAYRDMYGNTTVEGIWNLTFNAGINTITNLPRVDFTVNLEIPLEKLSSGGTNSTTDEAVTVPPGVEPPIVTDIIAYLVNVTENNAFGDFTGYMSLESGF